MLRSDPNRAFTIACDSRPASLIFRSTGCRRHANVAAAQNNLDDARAQFLRVVNSTPESLVEPVADAKMVPTSLDEALKRATKDNPTLLSSLQDIEAAKYQHEGAKANNYPKVSIEAGQTWYDDADGIEGNRDEMSAMLPVS